MEAILFLANAGYLLDADATQARGKRLRVRDGESRQDRRRGNTKRGPGRGGGGDEMG